MKRLNFTLDDETVQLLNELSEKFYGGNKSQTVRAALESLATHTGHEGWIITGYTPKELENDIACHSCGESHEKGNILRASTWSTGQSTKRCRRFPPKTG
ncbi:MAG: hypothetical protein U5J63_09945 [Fodinibius sp.]|nr:hypothetical protein [Fodinibius sp.]